MANSLIFRIAPAGLDALLPRLAMVLAGTAALAVSAKVQVPFWPVPMTLQTLVVLLIGALFGARMAGATLLAYLAEGAAGLPVFASGAGLAYLAGPTGGYLAGFVLAAVLVGWASDRGMMQSLAGAVLAFVLGAAAIYCAGLLWLSGFTGAEKAVAVGLLPFLPAEAAKIALASLIAPALWRRART